MAAPPPGWLPDWRDASAYPFERLDRAGFAWEWLRRDADYQQAASSAPSGTSEGATGSYWSDPAAAHWGLVRLERPQLVSPLARPLWRADVDRQVIAADASCGADDPRAVRFDRFQALLTVALGETVAHLLLTDGWRRLRIDLHGEFELEDPLLLRWRLHGLKLRPQLFSLLRLVSLARSGRFASRLWPRDLRTRRWILALRAHDALARGAGHRALAELLGNADIGEPRWRSRHASLRLQAQRLALLSDELVGTGFADRYL